MRPSARLAILATLAVLAACGPEKPYYRDGEFSLGAREVAVRAVPGGPSPVETVSITIVGKDVIGAKVVERYGTTRPAWLGAEVVGTGTTPSLVVTLGTALDPGTYRGNVTVVTTDRVGDAITSRDLWVTYTVKVPVRFTSPPLQFSDFVGTSHTLFGSLYVHEEGVEPWTVSSDAAWLTVTRSPSDSASVTVRTDGLPVGTYVGHVTLTGALPGETDVSPVELTISNMP
ncbi:MAG: hypothetical protein QM704_03370 [Anaeromyxobacteraceae bacterium]